jgi:CheY-like chemotaxis protein
MKGQSHKRPHSEVHNPSKGTKVPTVRASLLLVEDHEPTRISIQKILESRHFRVKCAATVAEAWAHVAVNHFDLLISDIGLPDGDGYLLMRELRDRDIMRGIALTGYGLEDDIRLSEEAGFSAHLLKPVSARLLEETLAKLGI